WIRSPVAGLRPSRALRCETLNFPKPENVISLPRLSVPSIVSSTASTAFAASFLLNPARSATWSTNSDFVTFILLGAVGTHDANRGHGRLGLHVSSGGAHSRQRAAGGGGRRSWKCANCEDLASGNATQ